MKKIFAIFAAIIIFCATNFIGGNFFGANVVYAYDPNIDGEIDIEGFSNEVVELVNLERERYGLEPLEVNEELTECAVVRAEEMPKLFSHTRPDGSECFTAFTVDYHYAGENLAAGQTSPEEAVDGWMNSPGHRANILSDNYTETGVVCIISDGSEYGIYWVQLFIG